MLELKLLLLCAHLGQGEDHLLLTHQFLSSQCAPETNILMTH